LFCLGRHKVEYVDLVVHNLESFGVPLIASILSAHLWQAGTSLRIGCGMVVVAVFLQKRKTLQALAGFRTPEILGFI
jgi:hypothetical protein